jgi:hypothetical protein
MSTIDGREAFCTNASNSRSKSALRQGSNRIKLSEGILKPNIVEPYAKRSNIEHRLVNCEPAKASEVGSRHYAKQQTHNTKPTNDYEH